MKKILEVRGPQAEEVLGLLKCVATNDGVLPLHEVHEATLRACAQHLFHTPVEIDRLDGTLEGAAAKVAEPELRREVLHMAGILPFLEEENQHARIDTFARLAREFGFSRTYAKELHGLCHGAVAHLMFCQLRPLGLAMGEPIWRGAIAMAASFVHLDGDAELLARYERYRELDEGIFGRVMTDYYRDNHFALPGTKGALFSNSLRVHDMHHVLAGYPTTPLGETCVIAFDAGMMEADLGKALIGYVAQFQVGIQFDRGIAAFENEVDPDRLIRAYERGGRCTVDYQTFDFDFDALLEQPLAEIRERFGLATEGALVQGPRDPWCGDLGVVGMRDDPNQIERKAGWLERLLSNKNVLKD